MTPAHKPSREELLAAHGRSLPDVIGPGLRVLFCGINPGLYSAAVQHHFARPGNRFWPALHAAGFTPRRLYPHEEREMLALGYGLTNIVDRATATADELTPAELKAGGRMLEAKARRFRPAFVAILGISAYRAAFGRPRAVLGLQEETFGPARIWLLPSPSGLNAHYQPRRLVELLRELRRAAEAAFIGKA
ncbi:MAG TPA: G/U mismatch-specific DNA glycosylase [Phycisphaerae bacterium]|jgi:TDG/mug DNA glycosylase family protein|nr:G/U mismatch-specific DNA glycosylase [Phycisphaerae bacterium]HOB76620.1 G/U mismatch-specific DNA glycosylase [Phycisphaerae bacterium]HOJ56084.1 G/U mismatch-specific DNA glycosylase [Phycisphaerae bacterium]HOL28387.1 G/U mismatch-specific DNA glycosylase [Phycisphaerae bacterium]HPP22858.1 G/U mismatch-specific DNA glycosylase [Phycisphaerae bacterium]